MKQAQASPPELLQGSAETMQPCKDSVVAWIPRRPPAGTWAHNEGPQEYLQEEALINHTALCLWEWK